MVVTGVCSHLRKIKSVHGTNESGTRKLERKGNRTWRETVVTVVEVDDAGGPIRKKRESEVGPPERDQ